jgi:filamentous hemagglutinin family protein
MSTRSITAHKTHRKSRRPRQVQRRLSRVLAWLLTSLLGSAGLVYAQVGVNTLPAGGQVVVGSAQLQQSPNLLTIHQSTQRLGLDWQSFNIGSGATVEFRQPGRDSVALNRVVGHSGSEIYGQLRANGQVFLVNPNGVLFAPGAKVDVGGLLASTLDISQADFAAGRYSFQANGGSGSVVNQGSLRASAGGYIALFGQQLDNQGHITVDAGSVVLASGRAATVSISGNGLISAVVAPGEAGSIGNSGLIQADGGLVTLNAMSAQGLAASLVNNSGIVRANTLVEKNGEVWITGDQVASSGHIAADAGGSADAGRVVIKGGMDSGSLQLSGSISAQAEAGRGGQVETSAAQVSIATQARVNTLSGAGQHGHWLIDPTDFTVSAGGGAQTTSGIGAATLAANLNLGSVTLATAPGGSEPGDIHVNAAVSWSGDTTLTLNAARNVNINANVSATSSSGGGLAINPGNAGSFNLATGSRISLAGSQASLSIGGANYTLVRQLSDLIAINASNTSRSGNYALANNLDASASATLNNGLGFTPIGNSISFASNNSFRGRFDGLGNTITGLTINNTALQYVGLFGVVHDAAISNLVLAAGSITGRQYVGALAGYVTNSPSATTAVSITNVHSDLPVNQTVITNNSSAGGLVGQLAATGSLIARSSSSGNVSTIDGAGNFGGLVGQVSAGSIAGSSASGAVSASASGSGRSIGGLVGLFEGTGTLSDASASGNVSNGFNIGGLVGYYGSSGAGTNLSATGDVIAASGGFSGGLIGDWNVGGNITTASASGTVTGSAYAGGLIGRNLNSGSLSGATASGNVSTNTTSTTYVGGLVGSFTSNVSGAQITGGVASGAVTTSSLFGDAGGLVGRVSGGNVASSSASGNVSATSSSNGRSVGGLIGSTDGAGTITGVSATGAVSGGLNAGGLIGSHGSAGLLSVATASGSVSGTSFVGGLIGDWVNAGSISDAQTLGNATVTVNSGDYAGGLVGRAFNVGTLTNAGAARTVTGGNYVGGLVGYFYGGNITTASASGTVTTTLTGTASADLGGLIGRYIPLTSGRVISAAQSTATVTTAAGSGSVGGLIGYLNNATLNNASASGNVNATNTVNNGRAIGGLVGYFDGSGSMGNVDATGNVSSGFQAGGLVGFYGSTGALNLATASGSVTGLQYVGGLIGRLSGAGAVSNSQASGNVDTRLDGGGLIGYWDNSGGIIDSRATGDVTSPPSSGSLGGLIGFGSSNGAINNSSASGNVSGGARAGGLAGYLLYTNVNQATASGSVTVTNDSFARVGGLIGDFNNFNPNASISNSSASGSRVFADAPSAYAGGLVGIFSSSGIGTITASSASAQVVVTDSGNTSSSNLYAGGLIGQFSGVSISDVSASGDVSGRYAVGGLVGEYGGSGNINNATATGKVSGRDLVGGLVGYQSNGGISNAVASGDVSSSAVAATSTAYVGGLVGLGYTYTPGGYSNTRASGAVSGGTYTGGLVGYFTDFYSSTTAASPSISNSSASGAVTGDGLAGGLIGFSRINSSVATGRGIRDSFATGNVQGVNAVGGLIGSADGYGGIQDSYATGNVVSAGAFTGTRYLGGLVGEFTNFSSAANTGQLLRSYASGDVTLASTATLSSSSNVYAGGLVGQLSAQSAGAVTLADSYATGTVDLSNSTGRLRAGGLVGQAFSSLARSYATGSANATGLANGRAIGGLVATRSSTSVTATNSYWATDSSGNATSVLGTAATLAQLSTASFYPSGVGGWDIASAGGSTSAWRIYDGQTTPLIRSLLTPLTLSLANITKVYDGSTALGNASISVGGTSVLNPERIFVGGSSASPNAGTYALAANNLYSNQQGYDLSLTGNATLTIDRRPLSIDGLVADKMYDGTTNATLNTNPSFNGLVAGESLTFQPGSGFAASFDTKTAGTGKSVTFSGSYTLGDGPGGLAANYVLPTAGTTSANITPATLTAGTFAATNRAYDGSTVVAVTATGATLAGVIGNDAVSVDLSGVTSGSVADKNVGSGKAVAVQGVSITGSDAANYRLAGVDAVTVDITPRLLTLNGLTANDRQYNRSTSISLVTTGAALTGVVSGDQVAPKLNGLGASIADKNVGNAKPVTIAGLGLRGLDAGNYSVQQGAVSVNISPYQMTASLGTTSATNRVYDGTTNATTFWPVSWWSGDDITVNASSIGYVDKNVAYNSSNQVTSKSIVASGLTLAGADAGNYTLLNTTATASGTIAPKPLAVTGVTATDRVYDGTRDVTVTISGATVDTSAVISGDQVSVATPGSGSVVGQMANKNAGTDKPVTVPGLTLTGGDAGNYTITSGSGGGVTVDIARKPLTAIYTAQDKVYDFDVFATMRVTSNDVVAGDSINFYVDNSFCGANACGVALFTTSGLDSNGNYTTTRHVGNALPVVITFNQLVGTDAGNYTLLNPTGTSVANITPKPVTLAFNGVAQVYDGSDVATVALNRSSSGVFGQDSLSTTQTALYTGANAKDVGTNKPISVSGITLSGTDAGNYTVANTTATTTGTVTAKPVTISGITATDRAYDGTTTVGLTAGTLGSTGFVPGDVVNVSPPSGGVTSGTMADKNVGTNKPVTVTGLTLTGADAGNYQIDPAGSGITVNISAAALTPTFAGVSRVYNGGTSATVTSTTGGIFGSDVVTFTSLASYTGPNARDVGTNKPISVSNIALGGSGAANYTLASTTATAFGDITPKPVSASYTGSTRVYSGAGDLSAAVVGSSLQFIAGDAVGLAQTALFADGNAGVNKPVSISNISLTGTHAANYTLSNASASTTATVTPKPLGVTGVSATSRVYDGTTTVAVNLNNAAVDTSAVIAGDQVSFSLPPGGITTGTMADRNAGAAKPVSITGIALTGSSAANYSLVGATGLTVNIAPRELSASYTAADKVYDGNADAAINATSGDILAIDSSTLGFSAQGVFSAGKNVGSGLRVAVSGTFLTGASRDNYLLLNPSGTATASITPRNVTALFGGTTRVYDGTDVATVTSTLQGQISGDQLASTQTAVFTGAGARNVGNGKPIAVSNATLTGVDASNYQLLNSTGSTTGSITPKPITVDGLNNVTATDRVYDGTTTVAVVVPAGVTLAPVSSDILPGDVVSINVPGSGITTGTMADKNAGTNKAVTVSGLTLAGTDAINYSIAGTTGVRVNITPLGITAAFAGVNRVYNGSAVATVTGSSASVIAGDLLLIQGSGTFTDGKNVGTGKPIAINSASLSGTDARNYTLLNTTGGASADVTPLSVVPTFIGGSRVYDGSTAAPVVGSSGGFIAGDNVSLAGSATFTGAGARNVGNNKAVAVSSITLAGIDAGNYSLLSGSATTTATITARPLVLLGLTGVSADDRAYDGSTIVGVTVNSTGTVTLDRSNIVGNDDVDVAALSGNRTTGTMLDKNAGTNKPVAVTGLALTGADAGNYTVAATSGVTVNISPRDLTASFIGENKEYDGTTTATLLGSALNAIAGDALSVSGSGVFSSSNAGNGITINVTGGALAGADAANYRLLNPTGVTSANITPRQVSVSYSRTSRVYDGTLLAPVSGSISRLIAGDDLGFAQTALFADKNAGIDKPVSISNITLLGGSAANYQLTGTSASTLATITPRPLGVLGLTGVTATDRVYDGTRTVDVLVGTTGSVSINPADLIAGDVVTITAPGAGQTTGTMLDKNVGDNKPVAVTGLTLSGADAGNYSVASTSGVTVNITPRGLNASFTGVNKVYDGTNSATLLGSSADVLAGDTVAIAGNGIFASGKNVGSGLLITVSGGSLGGIDAGNYSLLNPSGSATADITPRTLSASYSGGSRVYDGTTNATVTVASTGLVAGDQVDFSLSAAFADKNVGSGKTISINNVTLGGADAANYALSNSNTSTTGSITPRALNVTGLTGITARDRIYDGTLAVQIDVAGNTGSASGDVLAGDQVQVVVPNTGLGAGLMLDKHVGQNKAVVLSGLSLTGTDAGNYSITGTAGVTVNIAARDVSVAGVSATDRTYDGSTVVQLDTRAASFIGALAGDDLLLLADGATGRLGDKNAGSGKAVDVSGLGMGGSDARNYRVVGSRSPISVNIGARLLNASLSTADRFYDGSTGAAVTLADDRVSGDQLALTAGSASFASRNAGSGIAVNVSGIRLGGADAANYVLANSSITGSANINPAPLTVTPNLQVKLFGETLAFSGFEFGALGLAPGESLGRVELSSSGAAATAAVLPQGYDINADNASGGNFDPVNYSISYRPGLLLVLPQPPKPGESEGNNSGGGRLAVTVDPALVARSSEEFGRAAAARRTGLGSDDIVLPSTGNGGSAELSPSDIAALLAGDGRRITLPALQKLPLISLDPQLKRLMSDSPGSSTPTTTRP